MYPIKNDVTKVLIIIFCYIIMHMGTKVNNNDARRKNECAMLILGV
nr:MAG TPA: hypothetical protein [Caudoviricetes sp.]